VGADRPFELWFEAGPAGLARGTAVTFFVQGQCALGTLPQCTDSTGPGFVRIVYAGEAVLASAREVCRLGRDSSGGDKPLPGALGFGVVSGAISPGERVVLEVGRAGGFRWTPLAGRKEFKVMVDPGWGEPMKRLPEPVVVRVEPASADHLDVFIPGSGRADHPFRMTVSARDSFDNRVPIDAPLEVTVGGGKCHSALTEGRATIRCDCPPALPFRVRATCSAVPGAFGSNWLMGEGDLNLYVGDLHAHDFTCSAEGYPSDVMQWARDEKALDFVSLAPQTHAFIDNEKWVLHKHVAEAFLAEGHFVTFPAFEWQHSHYGDKVVHYLSGDQPYLPVDDPRYCHPAKLYEAVRGSDAIIISHHPGYALNQHVPGTDWDTMETDVDRLVELWSMHGSSEGHDAGDRPLVGERREQGVYAALRMGKRFGFTGGSDTHSARPGGSAKEPRPYWGGLCAVWASALTRRAVFAALWRRRTIALTGARIVLRFRVNDAWLGSEIAFSDRVVLDIAVWAQTAISRIEVMKGGSVMTVLEPGGLSAEHQLEDSLDAPSFYHCRVTLSDGHLAVCSPVWVG